MEGVVEKRDRLWEWIGSSEQYTEGVARKIEPFGRNVQLECGVEECFSTSALGVSVLLGDVCADSLRGEDGNVDARDGRCSSDCVVTLLAVCFTVVVCFRRYLHRWG